jgi:hypothetical protein
MFHKLAVAAGLITAAALCAPAAVSAGAQLPAAGPAADPMVQHAQFWDIGRCRAWRRECADRWGWRTSRYHRCLARHGCHRHRY